ncbi:hypothetical protein [Phaffia rhodozyma]|uniref:Uncharacterized protein n=1 Tax=Phaffia rhodozyma TaxID=264483 RepID=A0A0F7SJQ9_PHARH|nr:hypothetical protein [Phaffia rhodozyma]
MGRCCRNSNRVDWAVGKKCMVTDLDLKQNKLFMRQVGQMPNRLIAYDYVNS